MAKMNLNELKVEIASILEEAKKKDKKADDLEKKGKSIEAYGLYDEAFDFSQPLGAMNLYAQQGAVNWGPYTSGGPVIDSSFADPQRNNATSNLKEEDEHALRTLVREVIENGLIPAGSAWAPVLNRVSKPFGTWDQAARMAEAWYDRDQKKSESPVKRGKGIDKAKEYGPVQKHGEPKKKKGK